MAIGNPRKYYIKFRDHEGDEGEYLGLGDEPENYTLAEAKKKVGELSKIMIGYDVWYKIEEQPNDPA